MFFDTHSHLNFKNFDKDREKVIKRSLENEIWMINVATNFITSKKAVKIAEKYQEGVYAAIGLHPLNIFKSTFQNKKKSEFKIKQQKLEDFLEDEFDWEKYKNLAKNKKVVAIGEIGFDYWLKSSFKKDVSQKTKIKEEKFKKKQKEIFLKQLKLAKELNLPVIFHCRLAHQDLLKILNDIFQKQSFYSIKGVIHCFTGSWNEAKKYLQMGFYLGFNGIIFKIDLTEIIKKVPLEKILLETDCPFLSPPGFSLKRNEPLAIKYIAKEIAKIKKENLKKVIQFTTNNAFSFFNLVS